MANRENTFLLKRSNVPGKIPLPGDIKLGEVALNTADVILYASGTTANSILPIGWDRISRTGDTLTGNFIINGGLSATTISATTYLNLPTIGGGGDYLPLSGGTVTGNTVFTQGLTATTISATTYLNLPLTLTATSLNVDYIDFNTGATVTQSPGRISWDSGTGTLNIAVGDAGTGLIDLQVGQEEIVRVYNDEATTLQKGELVYVSGSQGNRPRVKRASAVNDGYSVTTLGMIDLAIAPGAEGYVTTFGIISNLNTLGLTGGTPIWLSPTTPGGYTSTKPIAPNHTVLIGYVVRVSATVGSIFVNISNGWELDELHDVRISGATTGDLLVRGSYGATPVWVNSKTLKGDYTISGNTSFIGSLSAKTTTNVNKFSGNTSTDLVRITQAGTGNAFVVEDTTTPDSLPFVINNAGSVGIGSSSPGAKLDVRAQGTTASDIAFRVRNSADTADIFTINGNGVFYKPHASPNNDTAQDVFVSQMSDGRNKIRLFTKGSFNVSSGIGVSFQSDAAGSNISSYTLSGAFLNSGGSYRDNGGLSEFNVGTSNITGYSYLKLQNNTNTATNIYISRTGTIILNPDNANAQVRGLSIFGGTLGSTADRVISIGSGTAPTTSPADAFQLYSADRGGVAGKASAYFRAEDGTINVFGDRTGINISSPQARLHVANADKTLTTALISGSGTNSLTVIGSGTSTSAPIFKVQGSSGELFSITDSLTGSLFSVNDISGLPILEVFSDNTILMGSYTAPSLNTTAKVTANIGVTTVYSVAKTGYTGSFFDYTVSDGTNLRAGNIMSVWSGSTIRFTETQTTDIGNTNNIKFIMSATTNDILLRASAATNSWTVKTIVRSI